VQSFTDKTGAPGLIGGIHQPQGSCTYTEPAVVGTFASFDAGAATYVSLRDERDNKVYPVVKIGGRWIMARNLNYQKDLHFNANATQANGKSFTTAGAGIPAIGSYWCPGTGGTSTKAACEVYGALYTWETAMMLDGIGTWTTDIKANTVASAGTYNHGRTAHSGITAGGRGICPPNWHVPTDAEWGLFLDAVEQSGSSHSTVSGNDTWVGANAGKRSKSVCNGSATDENPYWTSHASNYGTDLYGFRVLPTGCRESSGLGLSARGTRAWFWSSSARGATTPWYVGFDYDRATVFRNSYASSSGDSVRCMKD
jgi:uncharacterized protein (TIGR02145 family)